MAKVTLAAVKKAMEKSMGKDAIVAIDGEHVIIFVKPTDVKAAAQELAKLDFDHLSCITGVDYPKGQVYATTFSRSDLKEMDESFAKPCFEVIYELTSYRHGLFARLKTRIPRNKPVVPTVTDVWWNADWYERENYDLLGIDAEGHPDLRRLLLVDEFMGHPLRKDFQEED